MTRFSRVKGDAIACDILYDIEENYYSSFKTFILYFRKEIEIEIVEENCYEKNVSFFVELKSPKEESNGKRTFSFSYTKFIIILSFYDRNNVYFTFYEQT